MLDHGPSGGACRVIRSLALISIIQQVIVACRKGGGEVTALQQGEKEKQAGHA